MIIKNEFFKLSKFERASRYPNGDEFVSGRTEKIKNSKMFNVKDQVNMIDLRLYKIHIEEESKNLAIFLYVPG